MCRQSVKCILPRVSGCHSECDHRFKGQDWIAGTHKRPKLFVPRKRMVRSDWKSSARVLLGDGFCAGVCR